MRTSIKYLLALATVVAGAAWIVSAPKYLEVSDKFDRQGNLQNGANIFNIGGCASCHAAPNTEGEEMLVLAGGKIFPSPFGTFSAPNISPDPEFGIGNWDAYDLANAMLRGVSPEGSHYYPVFPYASYAQMKIEDVVDLKAYLDTLPPSQAQNQPHELPLPFRIRRSLGFWKLLFLGNGDTPIIAVTDDLERGRYLVEGPGHCAECHTPRNLLGGLDTTKWLAGAPAPDGKGQVPNITSGSNSIGNWSVNDIAYYLETGFTPDFDSVGGTMVEVVENTSKLSNEDRLAIAEYLKAIPPHN